MQDSTLTKDTLNLAFFIIIEVFLTKVKKPTITLDSLKNSNLEVFQKQIKHQ